MRKILAGFMATSMIVAVASATTFAAVPTASINAGQFSFNAAAAAWRPGDGPANGDFFDSYGSKTANGAIMDEIYTYQVDFGTATLNFLDQSNVSVASVDFNLGTQDVSADMQLTNGTAGTDATIAIINAPSAVNAADLLDGETFRITIDGRIYVGTLTAKNGNLEVAFSQTAYFPAVNVQLSFSGSTLSVNPSFVSLNNNTKRINLTGGFAGRAAGGRAALNNNNNPYFEDVDGSGALENLDVNDVVYCDQDGNPMVFTEKTDKVDEDQNSEDGVQSGKTLYFLLRDEIGAPVPKLNDDTYWKLKVTKGDNAKHIKSITDVSKNFTEGLYPLNQSNRHSATVGRHRYIKVELNEIYTDDEYKITLDMRISAKTKAVNAGLEVFGTPVTDDSEIKVKDFYFYMKNIVRAADNDWKVGIGGLMLNPLENDWNEVTYYDEDGDLAFMKFFADSNVDKFYAKLSTKWEHADYASYFNDQDAFIFNFTGSPKLSSTSRADLQIYNPFIDEDGNETIDPSTAVVYQVIDGDLYDVTDSFEYKEGENGDMAYCTRTRFLGTYIICEKAVEEAVADETVPDELTPDTTTEAPEDVTPDNNAGGKQPANTGKYL